MSHTVINEFGDEFTNDDNGNLIRVKCPNGFEERREYDDNGRIIHYKNSYGLEEWYDPDGNPISKAEFNAIFNQ